LGAKYNIPDPVDVVTAAGSGAIVISLGSRGKPLFRSICVILKLSIKMSKCAIHMRRADTPKLIVLQSYDPFFFCFHRNDSFIKNYQI
jgi:hypothetical protein